MKQLLAIAVVVALAGTAWASVGKKVTIQFSGDLPVTTLRTENPQCTTATGGALVNVGTRTIHNDSEYICLCSGDPLSTSGRAAWTCGWLKLPGGQ